MKCTDCNATLTAKESIKRGRGINHYVEHLEKENALLKLQVAILSRIHTRGAKRRPTIYEKRKNKS